MTKLALLGLLFFFITSFRFSRQSLSWENKEKLGLAQHYMVDWSSGERTGMTRQTGKYLNMSTLFYEFTFQRRTGFFILQVDIYTGVFVRKDFEMFIIESSPS